MPEQIMQDELKPCPGCGDPEPSGGTYEREPVVCLCGFRAPDPATWNTRADQTARNEVVEDAAELWLASYSHEHPNDIAYDADQMIDAYLAGVDHGVGRALATKEG